MSVKLYDHTGDYLMPYPDFMARVRPPYDWLGTHVVFEIRTPEGRRERVVDGRTWTSWVCMEVTLKIVPLGLMFCTAEDRERFDRWAVEHDPRDPRFLIEPA